MRFASLLLKSWETVVLSVSSLRFCLSIFSFQSWLPEVRVYFPGKQSCRWQTIQARRSGGAGGVHFHCGFLNSSSVSLCWRGQSFPDRLSQSYTRKSLWVGSPVRPAQSIYPVHPAGNTKGLKSCVTWAAPLLSSPKHFQALAFKSLGRSPCFIITEN